MTIYLVKLFSLKLVPFRANKQNKIMRMCSIFMKTMKKVKKTGPNGGKSKIKLTSLKSKRFKTYSYIRVIFLSQSVLCPSNLRIIDNS